MGNYLNHLEQLSDPQTFNRKKDYFKYNLGDYIHDKNIKALEIGPGLGEFVSFLNDRKIKDITIIDNDKTVLNYVEKKNRINKKFLSSNLSRIQRKLEKYDLILMMQVLEHIPVIKHRQIIRILYEHLNKDGRLFIIVPNANNPFGLVERYSDIQHTTSFTTQSLFDLANLAGINRDLIEIKGFEIPPDGFINILRIILQKILHNILLLLLIINGGTFFRVMTPNIMMILKRK